MKRKGDSDIASLFRKHAAKANKIVSSSPNLVPEPGPGPAQPYSVPDNEAAQTPPVLETEAAQTPSVLETEAAQTPSAAETEDVVSPIENQGDKEQERVYDLDRLQFDPGLRMPIASYPVNDQDAVRRAYILKGPCQNYAHEFDSRTLGGKQRHFSILWFQRHYWLEYSAQKDAAFCFVCYLFKGKCKGGEKFVTGGWRNWNRDDALRKHEGKINSAHRKAEEKYYLFLNPKAAIDDAIENVCSEDLRLYKIRLGYSLKCLRFLLHQGLAFRGHDESEESLNRGNFLELLKWLAAISEEVNKYVLRNAPGNCSLTSPKIQKQIIQCCAQLTRKKIVEELGDDYYAILADESSDVSHKEQLALCLRFVDKLGRSVEHFLGVVHVAGTAALSLKAAIESLLVAHGLTLTQIRGQGYDGASNMKGEIKRLKTLIMKESPSAHYIHCFAHQLQLVLVAVAKGNTDCIWFFDQVTILLGIVGVSCKRHDMLRDVRTQNILAALESGEIQTGTGLNQEMGLARPGETRWGSHYRTILHIIDMYPTILEVLIRIGKDPAQKSEWTKIHYMVGVFESFDFVFSAHLMLVILGYTNDLSRALQRRDQDIINAMSLVRVAKDRMQQMRSHGWEDFFELKVTSFCNKHDITIPPLDGGYVPYGRSARFSSTQTNDDHFRREVYLGVIDKINQELDNRFDEGNMDLLVCMSALNPTNSFASFDKAKVLKLATLYPRDILSAELPRLETQLDNFIDDMRKDDNFNGLNNLGEFSIKLVKTQKHLSYDLVYLLLKLALILPVTTATVERVFSAMTCVKTKLRNSMGDDLLDDCLVTYIERDTFSKVDDDDVINTFMAMRKRKPTKK